MLAIVIPYYKHTFFEATLDSLASQTDMRFKVYIGDDASPENISFLLENYKGLFDFIYHRFESNFGSTSLVKQWERCIAMIGDEEWIMILGDDDYLEPTVVASWYKHYDKFYNKSNVVRFASKSVNMKLEGLVSESFIHPVWEKSTDSYYRRFKGLTRSTLSEYVFAKSSYSQFRFYDFSLAWHSDDAAWLDFCDGQPIYTINESNVYVRFSDMSISGNKEGQKLKDLASLDFIKKSILTRLNLFNKNQQLDLVLYYESTIKKNRKLKYSEWSELFYFFVINFYLFQLTKCLRRFILIKI